MIYFPCFTYREWLGYGTGLNTISYVTSSSELRIDSKIISVFVFELSDSIKNLVSSLSERVSSLLPRIVQGLIGSERIDLTEDEVEKVLTDMDHDVLVLKDAFLNSVPIPRP